jgi:ketosteroid isomerase-like protein
MKAIFGALAFVFMLIPTSVRSQSDPATTRSVRKQIEPMLGELMLAANAHDTERFLAMYLRQPALVFVFNGIVINGWDDLKAQQLKWWNNGKSDVVYDQAVAPEFMVLSPGIAVVTSQMASRRAVPGGAASSGKFTVMMVWQKRAEGWRIVQAHESTVH